MDQNKLVKRLFRVAYILGITATALLGGVLLIQFKPDILISSEKKKEIPPPLQTGDVVKDGVHVATGLVAEDGYQAVITNCTNCHAADLIIQNRGTKERWTELIRWMQETQGLWDLGQNEETIVTYLAKHYAPIQTGRRPLLTDIEWYELKE